MQKLYEKIIGIAQGKKQAAINDADVVILACAMLSSYRGEKSIIKSLKAGMAGETKYAMLSLAIRRYTMSLDSTVFDGCKGVNDNLDTLLGIVQLGISTGANIEQNLDNFCTNLAEGIARKNTIRSKTEDMRILSLIGITFFFPLFSGITSSIAASTLSQGSGAKLSDGLRIIGISYTAIALFITNAFTRPGRGMLLAIKASLPLAAVAASLQTISYYLASYAL